MTRYTPKHTDIVGAIKQEFRRFIEQSDILSPTDKHRLLMELGNNHFDRRFDSAMFIQEAVSYSVSQWSENNFKLAELWQEIAKNNAMVNNTPHLVANETVEEFKKQFEINE